MTKRSKSRPPEPSNADPDGLPYQVREELGKAIGSIVERNKRDQVLERVEAVISSRVTLFSGPIPPAEQVEQYERVLPGSADRIISMAESALKHYQSMDQQSADIARNQYDDDRRMRRLGMVLGFVCFVLIIGCAFLGGYWFGWQFAGVFLAAGVISIIPYFLNAHRSDEETEPPPKTKR